MEEWPHLNLQTGLLQAPPEQKTERLFPDAGQLVEEKTQDVEHFSEAHNSKMFFSAIKSIYGSTQSSTTPLLSADGTTLIKDKDGINKRWWDHFSNFLTDYPLSTMLHLTLFHNRQPTLKEVKKAISKMSAGKAPEKDGTPAKIYKAAGPAALEAFHSVVTSILEGKDMPQKFRDASIVSLFKNKGSRAYCGNYLIIHW